MSKRPTDLGREDYRDGALSRLAEARLLYDNQQWVGAIYLAGRAVEAILRSLLWVPEQPSQVGHDLRDLLARVRSRDLMRDASANELDRLDNAVNELAVVWRNDLRYTGARRFQRWLDATGRNKRVGSLRVAGDPAKANARSVLEASERVVSIGEPRCRS
jgi:hypothetical protein